MSAKSRNKGAVAERQVAALLRERLGVDLSRRLSQYQSGGHDLEGWEGVAIEVKRHKAASQGDIARWWGQTLEQCAKGEAPLLAYRADLQAWRFVLRPCDWGGPTHEPAEVDIDGLCAWVRSGQQLAMEVDA